MGKRSRRSRLPGVGWLGRRIESWRDAGRPGKRMPEELWQAAAKLADEHGASRVSGELGLSYRDLKQRTAGAARAESRASARRKAEEAEFVEVEVTKLLGQVDGAVTEVEIDRRDGTRMKIRLGAGQRVDVEAVTAAFVGGAR